MENNMSADAQSFSLYHTDKNLAATRELMRTYIPLFAQCKKVLDIGCGPGLFLELLREQNSSRTLLGIDGDPSMVARVREKGFDARCVSVQEIASAVTGGFDGIYAGHIIEHLNGNEALDFLRTCCSLLNPGGVFLLKTPNWNIPYVRHEGFWLDITHVRPYPPRLLEKMLGDLGLVNVRTFTENIGLHDAVAVGVKKPD
ncbi:MAG: class I SAM-dependent methyltransferase [Chitinispirillaceae bacterium]|nr:class I SAM-dependent methyltransferase [Chitinispirillaceae bacterium]